VGKTGVHTRLEGLPRETNKELLLKDIKASGEEGAPFRELQQVLPMLSRKQVQLLLNSLREEGKISLQGERKNARWHINAF
jgi:ATP-dependent DNA helicase RecG